jgi:hypothetical protein
MTGKTWRLAAALGVLLWVRGAAGQDASGALGAASEGLRINHERLSAIYTELHDIALGMAEETEGRLDTIQKIHALVSAADRIGLHQWELLAVREMVCPERRAEFDRGRVRGLQRAERESRDIIDLLRLYEAFQGNAAVSGLSGEAIALLEGNTYLFERLRGILQP